MERMSRWNSCDRAVIYYHYTENGCFDHECLYFGVNPIRTSPVKFFLDSRVRRTEELTFT